MLRQLKLQDRLVAMAAIPIMVVAVVAAGLLLFLDGGATTPYGIFAGIGMIVSAMAALAIGRSIRNSIADMAAGASNLANAHRRLAAGEITAADLPQLTIEGEDDLAKLAASINAINAITAEAGETRRNEVREGLSNIVVNLARRSQTLLDRQVEYLDRLEGSEEDPDRLGELFKVDHLATRMRRNAESLKVLAEADPGRRRGGPVEVGDVLRVAMGEVENYESIELGDIDDGQVDAGTAMDLAHLVAELMENATQFSPPETPVSVSGLFEDGDRFVISIKDQGMGMPDDKLTEANDILANPPELGLGMGRSLGFMVIGRLAERLGATVTLAMNDGAGVEATVAVPNTAFRGRSTAPKPTGRRRTDKPAPAPIAKSASPALEKLLGLSGDALDDAAKGTDAGEAEIPEDWASSSPVPTERSEMPTLPSREGKAGTDETTEATDSAADTEDADEEEPKSEDQSDEASTETSTDRETDGDAPAENEDVDPDADASADTDADVDEDTGASSSDDGAEIEETWTPPEVTADAPPRIVDPPEKLTDAIPTGDDFESGVESLLNQETGETGLAKRQRGTTEVPVGGGRPVTASSRDPEEIKSMLSRYRDGLKGGRKQNKDGDESTDDAGSSADKSKDR